MKTWLRRKATWFDPLHKYLICVGETPAFPLPDGEPEGQATQLERQAWASNLGLPSSHRLARPGAFCAAYSLGQSTQLHICLLWGELSPPKRYAEVQARFFYVVLLENWKWKSFDFLEESHKGDCVLPFILYLLIRRLEFLSSKNQETKEDYHKDWISTFNVFPSCAFIPTFTQF